MGMAYKGLLGKAGADDEIFADRSKADGTSKKSLLVIDLERIIPDPDNPRRNVDPQAVAEMATSMRELGQQQPIKVRWTGSKWMIILGHTRYQAAKAAGMTSLEAVVCEQPISDSEKLSMQLIENCSRRDMNPIDQARSFRELMDRDGLTGKQLAARLGISESKVSRELALLKLPEAEQQKMASGQTGRAAARAAVVKRPKARKGRRRKPLTVKLVQGGVTVEITWRKQSDETSAVQALMRMHDVAAEWDEAQQGQASREAA